MSDSGIDPVTMQVVGNYVNTATNEIEIAMIRAAYSPVIKEAFDCSAGIVDPQSEYWAQADAIPLQTAVLASVHRGILSTYEGQLAEGDIVFTNDPFSGCPHLNDFVSIAPAFADGEIIAYVCTLMHHTDVGGKTPGSMPADATEIFQEGFRMPPVRLFHDDAFDAQLLNVMLANSRAPSAFRGDLGAQVAATRLGLRRIDEAVARFGKDVFLRHVKAYVDYTERMVDGQMSALAPGTYSASRFVDNADYSEREDGLRVVADVTVKDRRVHVDFSRSSAQVDRPLNVVLSNGVAASMVALRCIVGQGLPMNGGLQRMLTVTCTPGSIMNPVLPAAVGARALVAALAYDCVLDCLGQAAPELASATSSGGTTMPYVWTQRAAVGTEPRILVDNSLTGGMGARAEADGLDGVDNTVTNAMNYPAEMLEQEFPIVVERHELRPDSGGSGKHRGGLGIRRVVRFLADGRLALRGHRHQFPPSGLAGGEAGAKARFSIVRNGTMIPLAPQASAIATEAGDRLILETPGGGGFGPARERRHEDIRRDVQLGYSTAESARQHYGAEGVLQ
jgi:N-methylhydantoinase B